MLPPLRSTHPGMNHSLSFQTLPSASAIALASNNGATCPSTSKDTSSNQRAITTTGSLKTCLTITKGFKQHDFFSVKIHHFQKQFEQILSIVRVKFSWSTLFMFEVGHHRNVPIGSMYGIFNYIWLNFMVNVSKYTITWILWECREIYIPEN